MKCLYCPFKAKTKSDLERHVGLFHKKLFTAILILFALLSLGGCKGVERLTGGTQSDPQKPNAAPPHAFYVVSCCQDRVGNANPTYPTFLPDSQVQLCQRAEQACHGNDCQINGDTYLPVHADCGNGKGYLGDEYYAGKGY